VPDHFPIFFRPDGHDAPQRGIVHQAGHHLDPIGVFEIALLGRQ